MRTPNTPQKHGKKAKIIISVIAVVIIGGLATAAALFMNSLKPPTGLSGVTPSPSGAATPTPAAGEAPADVKNQRDGLYTFLVGGTDKDNTRTDVIMLVTFDTKSMKLNILNIPRDTMLAVSRKIKKANSAYSYGSSTEDRTNNFLTEISELIGFRVNRYVIVNFKSCAKIIDAVGGVEYNIPRDLNYDDASQDLHIRLKKGLQVLNGEDSVKLMRYRHDYALGDIQRIKVQQDFLKEAARQLLQKKITAKLIYSVADLILGTYKTSSGRVVKNTATDLNIGEIVWLANKAKNLNSDNISFHLLPGTSGTVDRLSYWLADKDKLLTLLNECFNPFDEPITDIKAGSK